MMKQILKLSWPALAAIVANISVIWVIVEFILYLVKDTQFNWWSVTSVVVFYILTLIGGIKLAVGVAKKDREIKEQMNQRGFKSKFQMRLHDAMEKQKE